MRETEQKKTIRYFLQFLNSSGEWVDVRCGVGSIEAQYGSSTLDRAMERMATRMACNPDYKHRIVTRETVIKETVLVITP